MPRRSILSAAERESLLALPEARDDLIRAYSLTEQDIALVQRRRGNANRLGFAALLAYLRYPGAALGPDATPAPVILDILAEQLAVDPTAWADYARRSTTRREHLIELQAVFGFQTFDKSHYRQSVDHLAERAAETDKGLLLATELLRFLRSQHVLLPSMDVIERICAEATARAVKRVNLSLTQALSAEHRRRLDGLLQVRVDTSFSVLSWLRQSPSAPSARHLLEHIERLKAMKALELPAGLDHQIHPNRLLKLAREGAQMTAQHLADLEAPRRYATLVATVLESRATVIDELVDWHDRMIGRLFNRAKRTRDDRFTSSGKAINEKVRLFGRIGASLLEARETGGDAFDAIEMVLPWSDFARSVQEAQLLAQPATFDYLDLIGGGYSQIHRYAPALLDALELKAAPAARDLLSAVHTLKAMNAAGTRKLPHDAPTGFVRKRWESLVFTDAGLDRRSYELCALSELKNSLRSGDIWVEGSRQFKDFDSYLLPSATFSALKQQGDALPDVPADCERYLDERLGLLESQLAAVNRLAKAGALPDALVTEAGLKITPLTNAVPEEAEALIRRVSGMLPRVKITELLMEVDEWTGFSRHFTHIKSGAVAADKQLLLTAILADAINLGLTKMAESCPGTSYARLSWLQAWHIRDDTYSAGLADLVNAQSRQPFSAHWGDGSTSSSDAQRFKAGGRAEAAGNVNPKYGSEPGVLFYTHISDTYAPFHTKVINVGVRDATYVLDGLLYHESDLRVEEHYTDTAGFTDHLFALMHLLGFRFAPRIRDLADKLIFVPPGSQKKYPTLSALTGGAINTKHIRSHWDEIRRLAASIEKGTVTASLMLRKLGSYPRQNGLAVAVRELGRIERSLFTLEWLQDVELRRRVQVGLNKGEAKNALARAVFFHRLGELRGSHL